MTLYVILQAILLGIEWKLHVRPMYEMYDHKVIVNILGFYKQNAEGTLYVWNWREFFKHFLLSFF